jgi:hypothetical protein
MNDPDITIPKGSGIYSLLLELEKDMCIFIYRLGKRWRRFWQDQAAPGRGSRT